MKYTLKDYKMEPAVFESMVNNLGPRIRHTTLTLNFESSRDKRRFMQAMQRQKEMDEIGLSDDSEQEEEIGEREPGEIKPHAPLQQLQRMNLEETFEMSILIKEELMGRLRVIGDKYGVEFMVVPGRVKCSGHRRDSIEDAVDEYRQLQENLYFEPLENYGHEIMESRYYRQLLTESSVHLICILRKHYYWFEKDKSDGSALEEVVNMHHIFYPLERRPTRGEPNLLLSGQGIVREARGSHAAKVKPIEQLHTEIKASLFDHYLNEELNRDQDDKGKEIELAQSRANLIMHLDALQQEQLQRKRIDELYSRYRYTLFNFDKATDMERVEEQLKKAVQPMAGFKKSKSSDSRVGCVWKRRQNYVIVAEAMGSSVIDPQQQKLWAFVSQMPKELLNFKLGIEDLTEKLPDEDWAEFLSSERDIVDQIVYISVKNKTKKKFTEMMRLYLRGHFCNEVLSKLNQRVVEQSAQGTEQSISVDISNRINETSLITDKSHENSNILKGVYEEPTGEEPNLSGQIQAVNFKFEGYKAYIGEVEGERYLDGVAEVEKGKILGINKPIEEAIFGCTGGKYKLYRVKIGRQWRCDMEEVLRQLLAKSPELAGYNHWITVFAGKESPLYQEGTSVKVSKLEKNSNALKEGYLLKTNLLFLYLDSGELPVGRYEAMLYARRL